MNEPPIMKCAVINKAFEKRWGNIQHFSLPKAKSLEKKGLVRILGEYKSTVNNKKYDISKRNKNKRRVVTFENMNIENGIPCYIPFTEKGHIAKAYNDIIDKLVDGWIIFIDHDVYLETNPYWHEIAKNAIKQYGSEAGLITCYTNRIKCKSQKVPNIDEEQFKKIKRTDDIKQHRIYAKTMYEKYKGKIKDITHTGGGWISGFFMMTHKKAWFEAGGFNESIGFFGVDNKYHQDIKNTGYKILLMQDLYLYHGYFRESLKPFFKEDMENGFIKQ